MRFEELENKLNAAKYINFIPFIGKKYPDAELRILVLGESHYGDKSLNSNKELTRETFEKDYSSGFFRNTAAMITGFGYYKSDFLWESMAFSNFFQNVIGDSADNRIFLGKKLIELSRSAFFELIGILDPHVVIAWGKGEMYSDWLPGEKRTVLNPAYKLFCYEIYPSIPVWCINHPSQAFSSEKLHNEWLKIKFEYLHK